jgi:hypothetical protein
VSANSLSRIIRFSTFELNLHTGELISIAEAAVAVYAGERVCRQVS